MKYLGIAPEVLPTLKSNVIYLTFLNNHRKVIIIGYLEDSSINYIKDYLFINTNTFLEDISVQIYKGDLGDFTILDGELVFSITDEEFNKHVLLELI